MAKRYLAFMIRGPPPYFSISSPNCRGKPLWTFHAMPQFGCIQLYLKLSSTFHYLKNQTSSFLLSPRPTCICSTKLRNLCCSSVVGSIWSESHCLMDIVWELPSTSFYYNINFLFRIVGLRPSIKHFTKSEPFLNPRKAEPCFRGRRYVGGRLLATDRTCIIFNIHNLSCHSSTISSPHCSLLCLIPVTGCPSVSVAYSNLWGLIYLPNETSSLSALVSIGSLIPSPRNLADSFGKIALEVSKCQYDLVNLILN